MKKLYIFLFLLFITPLLSSISIQRCDVYAETNEEYIEEIENQLDDLDFSNIEKIIEDLTDEEKKVFGEKSFIEKIHYLLNGDYSTDFSSFGKMLLSILFDNLLIFLPLIATIVAISILGGMIGNLRPNSSKSLENIVHFIIYGIIAIMVSTIIIRMINLTSNTLNSIKTQTESMFPILLTLLTALGGTTSVGVYGSAISILSTFIIGIFTNFIFPLFLISIALNFISNLSNSIKLNKLCNFINSLFKWVIGIIFTIFTGFITIQGITAGAVDGLSIKTAKFTIRNSLPLVGSYISDGLFLILASTNLIKNVIGGAGLLLLLSTIISPLIELILFMLSLKLIAGIIEPLGEQKISTFISNLAKSMNMLIVMIVSVSFMYLILIGLVMCSANII